MRRLRLNNHQGPNRKFPSCPGKSAKRVFALEVPGIHVLADKVVDGRAWPGHDEPWL